MKKSILIASMMLISQIYCRPPVGSYPHGWDSRPYEDVASECVAKCQDKGEEFVAYNPCRCRKKSD